MKTITIMVSEPEPVSGKKIEMVISMPMNHLEHHSDKGALLLRCVSELDTAIELAKESLLK